MICKLIKKYKFWKRYRLYRAYSNHPEFNDVINEISNQLNQHESN